MKERICQVTSKYKKDQNINKTVYVVFSKNYDQELVIDNAFSSIEELNQYYGEDPDLINDLIVYEGVVTRLLKRAKKIKTIEYLGWE